MKFPISKAWSTYMAANEPDVVTAGIPRPTAEALQASEPTAEEFLYAMDQLRALAERRKKRDKQYYALVSVAGYLYRKADLRAAGKDV